MKEISQTTNQSIITNHRLEEICSGYPHDKMSFGRIINFIALNDYMDFGFNDNELRYLWKKASDIKEEDYLSTHSLIQNILYKGFDIDIPTIDGSGWTRPKTEYEFIKYLVNNSDGLFYRGFSSEEEKKEVSKNIKKISTQTDLDIKECASSPLDMQIYKIKEMDMFISLRKKSIRSTILRYLDRFQRIIEPSEESLYEFKLYSGDDSKDLYIKSAFGIIYGLFESGMDSHDYLNSISNTSLVSRVASLYSIDSSGFKVIADDNNFFKALAFFDHENTQRLLSILNLRYENNFFSKEKDKSIVYAFNGQRDRNYLEGKLQMIPHCYEAELGLRMHCRYKDISEVKMRESVEGSPILNNILDNLLIASSYTKEMVFGDDR